MGKDALKIVDDRSGKSYEVPILYGTGPAGGAAIRASDLRQIKASEDDFGLMSYDPGLMNTAICRSGITFMDGEKGLLQYRGYPIEQLAAQSTYLEVAYLLLHGELPDPQEYDRWVAQIADSMMIHESITKFLDGFNYDAHTMGMLIGVLGALSTFYPDARDISEGEATVHICRLLGKVPTIAAYGYRHSRGLPYIYPDQELKYIGNFLNMLFGTPGEAYEPVPALERALEVLFILHADHEQNCSTSVMRNVGSSHADPYSTIAGAAAALHGPLHGGANEVVLRMLSEIGRKEKVPDYLSRVKTQQTLLPGFGHRVYKTCDPRVPIIKQTAEKVFEATGRNPLMDVALEIERIASEDEYFVSRRLFPNTEFYSGIVYQSIGLPVDMMSVMFAVPRAAGWLAQWKEMLQDGEQKIYRPRQVYTGPDRREYVPIGQRAQPAA